MLFRKLPVLLTAVLLVYWGAAFTATHWPMNPGNVPSSQIPHLDKVVHAGIYFLLAILTLSTALAWGFRWRLRLLAQVWLVMVMIGLIDESTQLLVAGRSADILDLAADAAGALLGILLVAAARVVTGAPARTETAPLSQCWSPGESP